MHENLKNARRNADLYLLVVPALLFYVVFHYGPLYGAQIAFKDFTAFKGIWGSPWVGFKHFQRLFSGFFFPELLRNTLTLSFASLIVGFPFPVLIALMLNYLPSKRYRRFLQTVLYAPHFISIVVVVSLMFIFLSPSSGIINHLLRLGGAEPIFFMAQSSWFPHLYVISHVWQHSGFSAIIYLGVLSSIDPSLYESAMIDGAGKFRRIISIDLPALLPTIVIIFILAFGNLMAVGFEKAYLMQTPLNLQTSEIFSTYIYKSGILGSGSGNQFSFASATGLFLSCINLVLILTVNTLARRLSRISLI